MWVMRAAALALLLAALAIPAHAQAPDAGPTDPGSVTPASQSAAGPAEVDASKLGVSMSRIQRGLRLSEARERSNGTPLKLEYRVQVFGTAPRIDVIEDYDLGSNAPLPYGAPTHAEFLQHWTPQAYRAPTAPVGALAGWALFQLVQRADKSKCEKEIAEYRALVMQGIAASAPKCSQ
jgi:hypothetical protein